MGTLVISIKENGKYKYTYNNRKGNTLFTSNSLPSKFACMSEITVIKKNFSSLKYLKYKTPAGKLYFKVVVNDFVIGSSRKFTTPLLLEKGLVDFQKNFVNSEVLDFTQNFFEDFPPILETTE